MKKYFFLGLSIVWMGVIFLFSAQTASASNESSALVVFLLDCIVPANLQSQQLIETVTVLVRKCAHMSEYALLVLWLFLYVKEQCKCVNYKIPVIISILYAISDEIHQLFVPGRSGQFSDVLVDTCGVFVMVVMIQLVLAIQKKRECKKN